MDRRYYQVGQDVLVMFLSLYIQLYLWEHFTVLRSVYFETILVHISWFWGGGRAFENNERVFVPHVMQDQHQGLETFEFFMSTRGESILLFAVFLSDPNLHVLAPDMHGRVGLAWDNKLWPEKPPCASLWEQLETTPKRALSGTRLLPKESFLSHRPASTVVAAHSDWNTAILKIRVGDTTRAHNKRQLFSKGSTLHEAPLIFHANTVSPCLNRARVPPTNHFIKNTRRLAILTFDCMLYHLWFVSFLP